MIVNKNIIRVLNWRLFVLFTKFDFVILVHTLFYTD